MPSVEADAFRARRCGAFRGIVQWQQLDLLWDRMKSGQWYFYQVGETPPEIPHSGEVLAVRDAALRCPRHRRPHSRHLTLDAKI